MHPILAHRDASCRTSRRARRSSRSSRRSSRGRAACSSARPSPSRCRSRSPTPSWACRPGTRAASFRSTGLERPPARPDARRRGRACSRPRGWASRRCLAGTLGLLPVFEGLPGPVRVRRRSTLFAAGVLLYLLAAALNYVLLALEAASEAERREAELAILAREAELAVLKAQIRPHFLFNSLNSISALASSDPPRAQQMCVRLGDFLRKSLSLGEKTSISVGEELELSRAYLAVEELRFGARLEVEEELDERGQPLPACRRCCSSRWSRTRCATGSRRASRAARVRVGVACGGGRLRILIENPFDPESPSRPGERPRPRERAPAPGRALRRGGALRGQAAGGSLPRRDLRSGGAARVSGAGPRPARRSAVLIVDDEEPARSHPARVPAADPRRPRRRRVRQRLRGAARGGGAVAADRVPRRRDAEARRLRGARAARSGDRGRVRDRLRRSTR